MDINLPFCSHLSSFCLYVYMLLSVENDQNCIFFRAKKSSTQKVVEFSCFVVARPFVHFFRRLIILAIPRVFIRPWLWVVGPWLADGGVLPIVFRYFHRRVTLAVPRVNSHSAVILFGPSVNP